MRRRTAIVIAAVLAACALAVVVVTSGSGSTHHGAVVARTAATAHYLGTSSPRLHCTPRARRFHTLPALKPTPFCVAIRRGATPAGDQFLVTPRPDPKLNPGEQLGLYIVSADGKLLWYEKRPAKVHDLKVVTYHGKPMLAYFERDTGGAYYQLLDQHYHPVTKVTMGKGLPTDEHELQITPDGTAYLGGDPLRHIRGVGAVSDYVVHGVDVGTGKVRFQWRALAKVPRSFSYDAQPKHEPWDYFHGNAIDPPIAGDPTVMVSSRNTSALFGIDPATGRTKWILGGKHDQFGIARHPSWRFCTQHDAHRLPGGKLLVFDNGGAHTVGDPKCPVHPARALLFQMDAAHRRIKLLRSISSVPFSKTGKGFLSGWVGSARLQDNGDMLVDWGEIPRVSEVSPGGREDLLLRLSYWSYRADPASWVGMPDGAPLAAAKRHGDRMTVWASWNGATQVDRWQVLAGDDPSSLQPVGQPAAFADLETTLSVRTPAKYVAVRALDARGDVLGTSKPVAAR